MSKHSRLKVQGPTKNRRVVYSIVLFLLFGLAAWFVEEHFNLVDRVQSVWIEFRENISRGQPPRGTIFDRNLKQLAVTLERVSAYARTREVEDIGATVKALGSVLSFDESRVTDQLQSGTLRVWLAEDINEEQELELEGLGVPGVYLQREEHRFYPNGSRAAHIIGYAEAGIGLAGVELYYDHLLAERKLELQHADKPVIDSQELVLNLDLKIQEMVEEVLGEIGRVVGAESAMTYLVENGTGNIVAAAHIPSFDPNNFTQVPPDVLNDRFLEVLPVPMEFRRYLDELSSLRVEAGNVGLPWSVSAPGRDESFQAAFLDLMGAVEGRIVNLFGEESSDSEENRLFTPVNSSLLRPTAAPVQLSPMGLLSSLATILSGQETEPAVVKKIIDTGSGEESSLEKEVSEVVTSGDERVRSVINQAAPLLKGMSVVGESGAVYLRDQVLTLTGSKWNTEFVLFDYIFVEIPVGEHDLSMLIVLQKSPEEPTRKRKDNVVDIIEAKVARIIILQQVSRTIADVLEREDLEFENFQGRKLSVKNDADGLQAASRRPMVLGVMPDLEGLSLRKSLRLIQGMPLEISIQGSGKVVSQKPPPGTPIKETTPCLLVLKQDTPILPD